MGILDSVKEKLGGNNRRHELHSDTVLVRTPLGTQKAEKMDEPGDRWRILQVLGERGPSTLHEVATEANISEERCKLLVKSMMPVYIREGSASE